MIKIKYFSLIAFLIGFDIANSCEKPDLPELVVTHVTHHFPKNGIMIPSMTRISDHAITSEKEQPNPRITLHWYCFDVLPPHPGNHSDMSKYVIIERGPEVTTRFSGGIFEDLIMVGPHRLSARSIILVPENELDNLKSTNQSLLGILVGYDATKGTALDAARSYINQQSLNPFNIKFVPKKNLTKLTKEQAQKCVELLQTHKNTTGARIIADDSNNVFLEEEVMPDHQIISVKGSEVKARAYLTQFFPKTFQYCEHSGLPFGKFEEITKWLFLPCLILAKGEDYTHSELGVIFSSRDRLILQSKQFATLFQELVGIKFESVYKEDQAFYEQFLTIWIKNMKAWYTIVQKQGQQWKTKSFDQTHYGNSKLLKNEIAQLEKAITLFNPHES